MTERSAEGSCESEVERLLTAAIWAGEAWTRRSEDPRVYREISQMLGVILHAQTILGSRARVEGPLDLIAQLRRPLAELVGVGEWSDPMADVAVLDDRDELTEEVLQYGAEYARALFTDVDFGAARTRVAYGWVRAEQVERKAYGLMMQGSDAEYSATRRFLVEHPAGAAENINEERLRRGAMAAAEFVPVPSHRSSGRWWWPCPVCRWPMRVDGTLVRCDLTVHGARYDLTPASAGAQAPRLRSRGGRRSAPGPRPVEGAVCVEEPVWRFMVVPGVAELDLDGRLRALRGVKDPVMWPGKDRCDLEVTAAGTVWEVDVKDHVSYTTILRRPISARHVVVPDYRFDQVSPLRKRLGETHEVHTVAQFVDLVQKTVRNHHGSR